MAGETGIQRDTTTASVRKNWPFAGSGDTRTAPLAPFGADGPLWPPLAPFGPFGPLVSKTPFTTMMDSGMLSCRMLVGIQAKNLKRNRELHVRVAPFADLFRSSLISLRKIG